VALTQRLDLRLGQSLVMTPQLQQAIKLLQMSSIELTAYVEEELERNPLLERDEKTEYAKPEREAREASDTDTVSALSADLPQEDRLRTLDTDLDNVFTHESRADSESRQAPGPSDSSWSSLKPSGGVSLDSEEMEFGSNLTRSETLAEHLTEQLHMVVLSPADRLIGQHLIGMVNEAGYLTGDIPGIAEALGTDMAHVESVLEILRGFDPPGVFAADLKECLALQLKDRDRLDPAMQRLLDHLPLVASATSLPSSRCARWTTTTSATWWPNCAASIPSRATRLAPSRSCRWCPMSLCGPRPTGRGWWNSTVTPCPGFWSTTSTWPR
jgi:RNA polymerase sigma-54 factor